MTTALVTLIGVLTLDHLTKAWVRRRAGQIVVVPGVVRLQRVSNRRLPIASDPRLGLLIWVLALIGAWVLLTLGALPGAFARGGVGALLGGSAGNLFERLRRGAVTDFVDLRVWPVFNVADAAIVVGCVALIAGQWTYGNALWP